jgi:hypothetical protein
MLVYMEHVNEDAAWLPQSLPFLLANISIYETFSHKDGPKFVCQGLSLILTHYSSLL